MSTGTEPASKDTGPTWLQWLSDPLGTMELNPVLTKDLRQAARSWTVIGAVMLLLAIYYFIALTFLLNSEMANRSRVNVGPILFGFIGMSAMFGGYIFIPIYVGVRTMMERASVNADLIYITTMPPQRIARGKLISGIYLIILFYSAAVPFLVFSYLLRGIDLLTVALSITITFLLNVLLVQGAITLAVSRIHIILKVLTGLFVGLPLMISAIFFTVVSVGGHAFAQIVGAASIVNEILPIVGTFILNWGLAMGFLYQAAVAQIAPPSANRSMPFRLYLTGAWLAFTAQFLLWSWHLMDHEWVATLLLSVGSLVVLGMFLIIGGQDQLSRRVKREIPADPLGRRLAFLFFNGTLSGMIWMLLIGFATLGLVYGFQLIWEQQPSSRQFLYGDAAEIYLCYVDMILYAFGYSLFSLWIHRQFFPKRTHRLACVFFLVLTILPALAVLLISFAVYQQANELSIPGIPLSVVAINSSDLITHFAMHFLGAAATALLGLLINFKWVRQQFTQFFRLKEQDA